METVIFACVQNAGRSQIAAALFNLLADGSKARAVSAGTRPAERVHDEVVNSMRLLGIDLSSAQPRRLTEKLAREASLLVTMGCGDACPYVPGLAVLDWTLADPHGRPPAEVDAIRDDIRRRVSELIQSRGWARSPDLA
jgi:arsenate reductase (thioredoxin)